MVTTEQQAPGKATAAQISAGGVPDPKLIMDWRRLRRMALTGPGTGRG